MIGTSTIREFRQFYSMDHDEVLLGHRRAYVGDLGDGLFHQFWMMLLVFMAGFFRRPVLLYLVDPQGSPFRTGRVFVTTMNVVFLCGDIAQRSMIFFPVATIKSTNIEYGGLAHEVHFRFEGREVTRWWFKPQQPENHQMIGFWTRRSCRKFLMLVETALRERSATT